MSTSKPIIIIGSGGHARVLVDALFSLDLEILFCTDVDQSRIGQNVLHVSVAGPDEIIEKYATSDIELVNGLGSINIPDLRSRVHRIWTEKGYQFRPVIHPSATISRTATIKPGAQIMAGAVIQTGAEIGENSIVNTCASIDHDCTIGDHCHIAPGCVMSGSVQIGDHCHIGTGSRINQNIRISRRVMVGAGATVTKDVPENLTVVGTPAKPIRK